MRKLQPVQNDPCWHLELAWHVQLLWTASALLGRHLLRPSSLVWLCWNALPDSHAVSAGTQLHRASDQTLNTSFSLSITLNQSINQNKFILAPYVTSESEAHKQRPGQVFTFTVRNAKKVWSLITPESSMQVSRTSVIYVSEFQTEGVLMPKALVDNVSVICCVNSKSLSDDRVLYHAQ